uniref:Uncharacterized protein n=1 Tax=Cannabis sativa TaxID=3483 RepID=A0A803NIK8_CANSA
MFKDCSVDKALCFFGELPILSESIPASSLIQFVENLLSYAPNNCIIKDIISMECIFSKVWSAKNRVNIFGDEINVGIMLRKMHNSFEEMVNLFLSGAGRNLDPTSGLELSRLSSKIALFIDASWSEGIMGAASVMITPPKDSWVVV